MRPSVVPKVLEVDDLLVRCEMRGYTKSTLPAIRQMISAATRGDTEAALRIANNLENFLEDDDECPRSEASPS